MKMTRFTRFIWLLIAAIGFLGFAGAAIAQGRGAIVSISRLGQGTATNPAGGYHYADMKVLSVKLDGTTLTSTLTGAKLRLTFPKKYFNGASHFYRVDTAGNSLAKSYKVTADANNVYVEVSLKDISVVTKGSFDVNILAHLQNIIPAGVVFSPKTELLASDGSLIEEASPMANPFVLANDPPTMWLFNSSPDFENANYADNQTLYAGNGTTSGGFTYIDPAQTSPLRYHVTTANPPNFSNIGAKMRYFPKGKAVIDLPTYPCVDLSTGTAVASTCTAVFDAALSPGWTQVGNQIILDYDVNGAIADTTNHTQIRNAITDGLNNKGFYLRYPNAIVNRDITMSGALKDLEPVNYDPQFETLSNAADTIKFKLTGSMPANLAKDRYWPDTRNFALGSLDLANFGHTISVKNRNSNGIHINKIVDYNLDPRLYISKIWFSSRPYSYQQTIVSKLKIHAYKSDGSGYDVFTVTPSTGSIDSELANIDPDADAAVAAQIAASDAGAAYATLGGNTRKYDRFEFVFDPGETLPAGWAFSIRLDEKLLNPYQETFHQYPFKPGSTTQLDQPPMRCKPDGSGSENLNAFCNYVSIDQELLLPTGNVPSQLSTPSTPIWYTYKAPSFVMESANVGQGATQLGSQLDARTYATLCDFAMIKGLSVTALLPPGADYTGYTVETWAGGATNASIASYVDSATVIPDFQGTGLKAVKIKFKDFKTRDVWKNPPANGCVPLRMWFKLKINEDAIPMPLVSIYETKHAAQAGQIPSDKANEVHYFWKWEDVASITKETNASNRPYAAKDASGNLVFGIGNGVDTNPAHNPNTYPRPDVLDLNNDGSTSDLTIRMNATFNATIPTVVNSEKFIFPAGKPAGKTDAPVPLNEPYVYRIQINNQSTTSEGNVLIYDVLPRIGDSNYQIPGSTSPARNSQFDGVMTGPATGNATDKYDIKYCTTPNPTMDPVVGVQDAGAGGCAWQATAADWSTVTAVRIELKAGQKIEPLSKHYFDLPMIGPDTDSNYETGYDTSTNSFAVSYSMGALFGTSNSVTGVKNVAFPVKKIWRDGKTRPAVTIDLYADGVKVGDKSLTLTDANADPVDANTWLGEFKNLPSVNADGSRIVYTIKENRDGANGTELKDYQTTINGSVALVGNIDGYTVTNQYVQPEIEIPVEKKWINGQTKRQPIELTLYRKIEGSPDEPEAVPATSADLIQIAGKTCETANPLTLTPSADATDANAEQTIAKTWCVHETDIAGQKYVYSVKETLPDPENWTTEYDAADPKKITNTYKVPTYTADAPLVGTASWINGPLDGANGKPEAYMQLYRTIPGGTAEAVGDPIDVSTAAAIGTAATEANGDKKWTVEKKWDDLPKTDKMGRPYTYTLIETDANKAPITPPGYDKTENGMEIVNTYRIEYVEIKGTKNWAGASTLKRPAITVGLYIKTEDGRFVKPESVGGDLLPAAIFTNGSTPGVTYETAGTVSVPESTAAGLLTQSFYWRVPKTYRNGTPVVYYFDEEIGDGLTPAGDPLTSATAPANYEKTYDYDAATAAAYGEMKILNTYKPPLVNGDGKVAGDVKWVGGQESDRDSVTIELKRKRPNGAVEVIGTVTLDKNDAANHNWKNIWENLPKTDQATGEEFRYWIDDTAAQTNFDKVKNETTPTIIAENDTLTLTYKYRSPKIEKFGNKVWSGGSSLTRPDVTLTLYRNIPSGAAEKVPAAELFTDAAHPASDYAAANGVTIHDGDALIVKWYTNEKNPDGIAYIFTIDEDEDLTPLYEKTIDNGMLTVTNQYVSPKAEIHAKKVWSGGAGLTRPAVTLTLYRKVAAGTAEKVPAGELFTKPGETYATENGVRIEDGTNPGNTEDAVVWYTNVNNPEGVPYEFSVDEELDAANPDSLKYKKTIDATTRTITNTYLSGLIGTKQWIGGEALPRPAVTLTLYRKSESMAAEEAVGSKTIDATMATGVAEGTASWENMPENDPQGKPYTYRVDEMTVPTFADGTFKKVDDAGNELPGQNTGMIVRNKFFPNQVSKTGEIVWLDGGTLTRPAVRMQLYRITNGGTKEAVGAPVNIPDGTLSNVFTGLDERDPSGKLYTYTVDVVTVPGLYQKVDEDGTTEIPVNEDLKIHLRYIPPRITVTGTKNWVNGSALLRPAVELLLMQDGNLYGGSGDPKTIPAATAAGVATNTVEWTDLPKTQLDGTPYGYTVVETAAPANYTKAEAGQTVTNTYVPPMINNSNGDVTGEIEWVGGPDAKPAVTVTLKRKIAGGTETAIPVNPDATVPASSYWTTTQTWSGLPATDLDGNPYIYTLHHHSGSVGDYTREENGLKVTYRYQAPTVDISGKKIWSMGQTLRQPIQLALFRQVGTAPAEQVPASELRSTPLTPGDPCASENPVTLTPDHTMSAADPDELTAGWCVAETNDAGQPYVYTVQEVSSGHPNFTKTQTNATTVTNTFAPTLLDQVGKITWQGGPDPKPGVQITLTRVIEGLPPETVETGVAVPPGTTEKTWPNLPATDTYGRPYTYTIHNDQPVPNYPNPNENGMEIVYRYVPPVIPLTGQKTWIKGQMLRAPIELALFRSVGGGTATQVPAGELRTVTGLSCETANPVTLTPAVGASEPDSMTLDAKWCVDETDFNGQPYTYTVQEVNGLTANWTKVEAGLLVTNTFKPTPFNQDGNLVMTKKWVGGRPVNVTFTLKRTTAGVAGSETVGTYTLTVANATGGDPKVWTEVVPNLNAMDQMGRPYTYTVEEAPVANFGTEIDNATLTVTNTYVVPRAPLQVEINWIGGPATPPATLATVTDNKGNTYTVDFPSGGGTTNTITLPITDEDGNPLTYKVHQPNVPENFTETIDQPGGIQLSEMTPNRLSLTNTYVPPKAEVTATKVWVNGEASVRPTVWFKLYRNIQGGPVQEVPLAEAPLVELPDGTVEAKWTGIELRDHADEPYIFTVKEVDASGADYEPANYTKAENGLTVTNTFVPPSGPIVGKKAWGLGPAPRPTVWLKVRRQVVGGPVEDVPSAAIQPLPDGTTEVTWPNVALMTLRGESYTFTVQEVDASGNDFTPAGYFKTETGLTAVNAKLSRLTVGVVASPLSDQKFGVEVRSDTDVRPTQDLDYNGEEAVTPSTVTHDNMNLETYRISIPKLDTEVWAVDSISCVARPLDSTDPALDEPLTVDAKVDFYGKLTGLFSIPQMPLEKDIRCTYNLRNLQAGRVVTQNTTYPNPDYSGFPDYNYATGGTGLLPFQLSTTSAPNVQEVTPGQYTIVQQNLEGWTTIDVIVTSSVHGRRPLKALGDQRVGTYSYGPTGSFTATDWETVATVTVEPKEEVTLTFVNVPPNTIMAKKVTIPAKAGDRFSFIGVLSGEIGDGEYLIKTGAVPDGKQWQSLELEHDGWTKHSVKCVERGRVGTLETREEFYTMSAYYGLDDGEVILCTFTNRMWGVDEQPDVDDPDLPPEYYINNGLPLPPGMAYSNGLPRTGFTPGKVTTVGEQPAAKKYQASEITLRIPKLNVELGVTGVQKTDGNWDVSWLNGQAGYLEGSAYPTWAGNSVITAHVWDAYNNPGPFAGLKTLGYGDQVEIEAFGKTYVYEVRETKQVTEQDVETVMAEKDGTWITLLTCEDYSEKTDRYAYRRVVQAVLIEVK